MSQDAGIGGGLPEGVLSADVRAKLNASGQPGAQGPQGVAGPPGPPGSDASINGVAAGGDLAGSYPNPSLAARSVGPDQLDTPIAARLTGPDVSVPDGGGAVLPIEQPDGTFGTFDTGGFFTPAEPTNATVPLSGIYRLSATVSFFPDPDGSREVRLERVGAAGGFLGVAAWRGAPSPEVDGGTLGIATMLLPAQAGDAFRVRAEIQAAGTPLDADLQSFDLAYLGPLPS